MTRPMSPALEQMFNSLTETDRQVLLSLLVSSGCGPLLTRVLNGIGAQVLADKFAEDRQLQALEADRRADLDALDLRVNGELPKAVGPSADFDPETREWRTNKAR